MGLSQIVLRAGEDQMLAAAEGAWGRGAEAQGPQHGRGAEAAAVPPCQGQVQEAVARPPRFSLRLHPLPNTMGLLPCSQPRCSPKEVPAGREAIRLQACGRQIIFFLVRASHGFTPELSLRGKNSLAGLQRTQGCGPAGREAPLLSPVFYFFSLLPSWPKGWLLAELHLPLLPWGEGGGRGTRCQLLSCFTLQQLTMCFFSPEPDPTSCKQHAKKTLNLLAKKMGFPSQAGEGREINPAAKNSEIRKRF